METVTITEIIKDKPIMLSKKGKILNTWKIILGYVPIFDIQSIECYIDNEYKKLTVENDIIGIDENGNSFDITKLNYINKIDLEIEKAEKCYLEYFEDIVIYKNNIYTIYEILETEVEYELINSLPIFDHSKIKIIFENKIKIGYKEINNIIKNINYYNIEFEKYKYGYVKRKEILIPFSCFYNKKCNDYINNLFDYNIPLINNSYSVKLL